LPHALAAPTARAPRVPQGMRSATRGPRSWPPRSRPTRPSPRCTSAVRAAAPLPNPAVLPHAHARSPRPPRVRPACRRQSDRRRGGQGAGRCAQGQRGPHHAEPRMCVQRRPSPHPCGTAAHAHACRGGVRRAALSVLPHALAAPTARAPRVPQSIGSATREPGSWPPR